MRIDINRLNDIAVRAGEDILKIYNSEDFEISTKADNSPLTIADRNSHDLIKANLSRLYPEIPVVSEEDHLPDYESRRSWKYFWLVDPLDGTKEFIHRNGEFTVNIALIQNDNPVAGVIYVPVTQELYYADCTGAYKQYDDKIRELCVNKNPEKLTVVKSRSHSSVQEDLFFSNFVIDETITAGSSIKFCLIAEGRASLYYRSGPTWEWDTAAGHAIVKYAGGYVTDATTGEFLYNKETLLNNAFCASSFKIMEEHLNRGLKQKSRKAEI